MLFWNMLLNCRKNMKIECILKGEFEHNFVWLQVVGRMHYGFCTMLHCKRVVGAGKGGRGAEAPHFLEGGGGGRSLFLFS